MKICALTPNPSHWLQSATPMHYPPAHMHSRHTTVLLWRQCRFSYFLKYFTLANGCLAVFLPHHRGTRIHSISLTQPTTTHVFHVAATSTRSPAVLVPNCASPPIPTCNPHLSTSLLWLQPLASTCSCPLQHLQLSTLAAAREPKW